MIIPPDPEKDPNLFRTNSNSTSTTFIAPPSEPSDLLDDVDNVDSRAAGAMTRVDLIRPANALRRTSAFSFSYSECSEDLPPYERRQRSSRLTEGDVFGDSNASARRSIAPSSSSISDLDETMPDMDRGRFTRSSTLPLSPVTGSRASSSRTYVPGAPSNSTAATPIASTPTGSAYKLWESSASGFSSSTRRAFKDVGALLPTITWSPETQKWWKRYRRWVQGFAIFLLVALGLIIGLALGFKFGMKISQSTAQKNPWNGNGPQSASYQAPNLNLTYIPSRDGPQSGDGEATNCNQFVPFNTTSASLDQLAVASSLFDHSISNYTFPLTYDSMGRLSVPGLYFIARGIAAGGTVEFVGSDGPADVISGGMEGAISVDIIVRYPSGYNLTSAVRVCQMSRNNGSVGVGIYTPVQTSGGVSNPFALNPFNTPSFHIVVRLPPSLVSNPVSPEMFFPSLDLDLAQMAVRMGNMNNVLNLGTWSVSSARGGVVATYIAAQILRIQAGMSSVQGKFNVSQTLTINATQGTILADVILFNPNDPNDNSTTLQSTLPFVKRDLDPSLSSRNAIPGYNTDSKTMQMYTDPVPAPTHAISTSFTADEGFIFVAYLHHPPSTSLQCYTKSSGGTVSVSMHPNFVGALALQNEWGEVRLPPVDTNAVTDPQHLNRVRTVLQGKIDMSNGTLFAAEGINDTSVANAAVTVTGVAFWAPRGENDITALEVQQSPEAKGSELVVVGSWGDVQVTFDGSE